MMARADQPRELITPGLPFGPTFIPYCRYCNIVVERYWIETPTNPHRISIDAQCCGKHQGAHIRIEDLRQVMADGGKFYVIDRPGSYQRVSTESVRADMAG
jgi:hypothetical protein